MAGDDVSDRLRVCFCDSIVLSVCGTQLVRQSTKAKMLVMQASNEGRAFPFRVFLRFFSASFLSHFE